MTENNHIHEDSDGNWWFMDFINDYHGPFLSENGATTAYEHYCEWIGHNPLDTEGLDHE